MTTADLLAEIRAAAGADRPTDPDPYARHLSAPIVRTAR